MPAPLIYTPDQLINEYSDLDDQGKTNITSNDVSTLLILNALNDVGGVKINIIERTGRLANTIIANIPGAGNYVVDFMRADQNLVATLISGNEIDLSGGFWPLDAITKMRRGSTEIDLAHFRPLTTSSLTYSGETETLKNIFNYLETPEHLERLLKKMAQSGLIINDKMNTSFKWNIIRLILLILAELLINPSSRMPTTSTSGESTAHSDKHGLLLELSVIFSYIRRYGYELPPLIAKDIDRILSSRIIINALSHLGWSEDQLEELKQPIKSASQKNASSSTAPVQETAITNVPLEALNTIDQHIINIIINNISSCHIEAKGTFLSSTIPMQIE